MIRLALALALALLASPALAQQQSDPAFLQQAIASLQQQRNQALDQAAVAEANGRLAAQEIEKLRARVKELEAPKSADPPK